MATRDGAVIVLLSTPWAGQKQQAGQARERWQQGQRRYKASDFQLRGSDVAYIMDKAMSCDLGGRLSDLFQKWQASGSWQDSSQLVIGAAKLQKPRGLQNMGELRSREDFLLWHAWGRPLPHEQFPQMLFFEVLESVCFVEEHDLQVFATRLRVAEQRSSWVARLSDAAQHSLQHAACTDGRSFQQCLREWGVVADAKEHVVFTSLGPLVHLVSRGRWHVLADMARCTRQLLRKPKGACLHNMWLEE